ncbi:uncharacterized protein LOC135098268 isoform X1 [Scylla paramamosain]|uniref:uncharacterized protein LOC135098268 isoform X1 n=1 Tax=Scylla paramamosain TaxID=85552 RepID=UPI0030839A93
MTEQKCHVYLGGIQTMHYRTFEDKMGLPGMLGTVVGDVKPFCGRKAFRLLKNEPRIFRETASNSMLNANTYTYLVPGFLPCPSSSISDGVKGGLISASCHSKHPSSPYINIISTPTGQDIR